MTYRHRKPESSSGAVIALGFLFVLLAAGVLYGAYRWVKRKDESPPAPGAPVGEVGIRGAEVPFDNVLIDPETDAFVMVVEVPVLPDSASFGHVLAAVSDCLAFRDDAGLYPEAAGRERVVRVQFDFIPDRRLLARLPLDRVQVWVYGADQKVRPLTDAEVKQALAPRRLDGEPEPPPPEPEAPAPVRIDMVLENPDTGVTALVLIQDEPWSDKVTEAVRRRIDSCYRAAESGNLTSVAAGEKYEIHVQCRERPGAGVLATLGRTYRVLKSEGVRLRLYVAGAGASEEIPLAR